MLFKGQLFSRDISHCVPQEVIKNFRSRSFKLSEILALMKHYQKMFVMNQFLRKNSFPLFSFSLKRLVSLERKRLIRHRFLLLVLSSVEYCNIFLFKVTKTNRW